MPEQFKSSSDRKTSIIVGVLFIVATALLFVGQGIYDPVIGGINYLETAYPGRWILIAGIFVELICVLVIPLIAVFFFPVLKRHDEGLAIGYIVFRTLEAVVLITVAEVNKLSLIGLSRDYLARGETDAGVFHAIGGALQAQNDWGDAGGPVYLFIFIIGALMLYTILFRSRLVPRLLSVWGIAGALALGAGSVLFTFDLVGAPIAIGLMVPIAVQEMVMAVWLIVKGFNPSANAVVAGNEVRPV